MEWSLMPEFTRTSPNVDLKVHSRLQLMYHGQPYVRVGLIPSQGFKIRPLYTPQSKSGST